MARLDPLLIGLSVVVLAQGIAVAQPIPPGPGAGPNATNAAPANPSMTNGMGGGPSGTVGDPNTAIDQNGPNPDSGALPGAATTSPPAVPSLSRSDAGRLAACQAMSHAAMMANRGCRALIARHPGVSGGDAAGVPPR